MDHPSPDGSVTRLINRIKAGDSAAVQPLWEGYFTRLVRLARGRLHAISSGVADEEDIALAAFDSFFRGVEKQRFPRLDDRHDLWQILIVLTERKATGQIRYETREKRDRRQTVQGSTGFGATDSMSDVLATAASSEPSPEFAAEVAEECTRLLDLLGKPDDPLRQVAVMKMEGFTNEEIAVKIQKAASTVERKLAAIRNLWEQDFERRCPAASQ